MAKSKVRQQQDAAMDTYTYTGCAWHYRQARKLGGGNASEGVRIAIEKAVGEVKERRTGPKDRRRQKK